MLNFLENHDEVRFGSKEFASNPAKVLPFLVTGAMMSKGPFMIYYGQELGEMARDNEGFAGDNNRSTIFDYWSYSTLRRWWNHGKCNVLRLTAHERWLRGLYARVLRLCNEREAIRRGAFFDLMYVNLRNNRFNPHRQYAFIRYTDREALLIVVNFGEMAAQTDVIIPELAFDMAGLAEGKQSATDLVWGKKISWTTGRNDISSFEIGGYDAIIVPLKKIVSKT